MLCAADTAHLAAGLRRFSTKLWPLESEDEIVALLLGMARYPVDTPDRAELIAADMQTKHASTTINVRLRLSARSTRPAASTAVHTT